MKFSNTTSTALLAGAAIVAIAVLSGLGHPVPGALVTLAGGLVAGHLVLKVPGVGTVSLTPSSSATSTTTAAPRAATTAGTAQPAATSTAPSAAAIAQHPSVVTTL